MRAAMRRSKLASAATPVALCSTLLACHGARTGPWPPPLPPGPAGVLPGFNSKAGIGFYMAHLRANRMGAAVLTKPGVLTHPDPSPPSDPLCETSAVATEATLGATQHPEIDEGGTVRVHGEHLVVLHHNRLLTIRIGSGSLEPVGRVEVGSRDPAAGPVFRSMVVSDDTAAVVGEYHALCGTPRVLQLQLVNIDRAGQLTARLSHVLSTGFSTRIRLVGTRLVLLSRALEPELVFYSLPRMGGLGRLWSPDRVFVVPGALTEAYVNALVVCDLHKPDLQCSTTVVLGPKREADYVSPRFAYLWTYSHDQSRHIVIRLPLDGSAPSALGVSGEPSDSTSFFEGPDGFLNVALTSKTDGESPPEWSDRESGALALLRIAPGRFSDGRTDAPLGDYHRLSPNLPGSQTHFRFVGPYLLYGARDVVPRAAYTIRYAHPDDVVTLPLTHHVETIEPLGQNAVVVGSDGFRLLATRIALGREPQVDGSTSISSGTRSYRPPTKAFYFAAEGAQTTLFGLPTTDPNRIYYLESGPQRLRPIGLLNGPKGSGDDLSCAGWPYAVTPVFADGRVFGLVSNEIVELRRSSEDGFLTEYRRVNLVSDSFATRTANPATP